MPSATSVTRCRSVDFKVLDVDDDINIATVQLIKSVLNFLLNALLPKLLIALEQILNLLAVSTLLALNQNTNALLVSERCGVGISQPSAS